MDIGLLQVRSLVAIRRLRGVAWAGRIAEELHREHDWTLNMGNLYASLNALERRGFLTSRPETARSRALGAFRPGAWRKVYVVTEKGRQAIREALLRRKQTEGV